jgi:hypothetical protein
VRPADLEKSRGTGEFFAIDRRTWGYVCGLGINAAVVYLVLARDRSRQSDNGLVGPCD